MSKEVDTYKIFRELEAREKRANPYKFYDKDELIDEILKDEDEIERLNNVISELEEEYINYMDKQDFAKKCKISRPYLDKLLKVMNRKEIYEFCKQRNKIKELKGSEKE